MTLRTFSRFVVLLAWLLAKPLFAANHVRVILDTSQSMNDNDKHRLAVLSTILLFDLADPQLTYEDSFAVLPFDSQMAPWKPGASPPSIRELWIRAANSREDFVDKIKALPYDAGHTYYFPVLQAAISDLQGQGRPTDRRVIVLVTDGQPEDADQCLAIRNQLVPRMQEAKISLYILALGRKATSQSETIRNALGGRGNFFTDKTGQNLPGDMIDIFSHSFGYTAESRPVVSGSTEVDLEAGQAPERAAVALYWKKSARPALRVRTIPDADVNSEPLRTANEVGGSYAVSWILYPRPGGHKVFTDAADATVVVLRPADLIVEVLPPEGGQILHAVMFQTLPIRVRVRPSNGPPRDPGPVTLTYEVHGALDGGAYAWDGGDKGAEGMGTHQDDGRYFEIQPQFLGPPCGNESHASRYPCPNVPNNHSQANSSSEQLYHEYLTIAAHRGERSTIVGAMDRDRAHHVFVHPWLQIQPTFEGGGLISVNGQSQLPVHSLGCANFKFYIPSGQSLPHPEKPTYSVRAVLGSALASDPRVQRAQYWLDGEALSFQSAADGLRSHWAGGRSLSKDALLGDHQLCMQVEKTSSSLAGASSIPITLEFTLMDQPYETYKAVSPLHLAVVVVPPLWTEKYSAWLALGLGFITLLALFWYLRFRPEVPFNLQFALGEPPRPEPLGEGSLLRRWLGLIVEKPVFAKSGGRTLGWVRPVNVELYRFRPAEGVSLEGADGEDGCVTVGANQTYPVTTKQDENQMRLQYP